MRNYKERLTLIMSRKPDFNFSSVGRPSDQIDILLQCLECGNKWRVYNNAAITGFGEFSSNAVKEETARNLEPLVRKVMGAVFSNPIENGEQLTVALLAAGGVYTTAVVLGINPQNAERAALNIAKNLVRVAVIARGNTKAIKDKRYRIVAAVTYAADMLTQVLREGLRGIDPKMKDGLATIFNTFIRKLST